MTNPLPRPTSALTRPLRLLSIQSHVVYGHVGNSAAVFPLQRMGHEVLALNTVQFSNHTGYGSFEGLVFPPTHIADLLRGLAKRDVLKTLDGVLSGYLGSSALGEEVADAAKQVKVANPKALFCCDPVLGDVGRGLFVAPELVGFFRDRLMPLCDLTTPNQFELEQLTGVSIHTRADVLQALTLLHALGPKVIVVTSLCLDGALPEAVSLVVSDMRAGAEQDKAQIAPVMITTPKLARNFHGAGDLTTALFFAHYLGSHDAPLALRKTAASVYGVLQATQDYASQDYACEELALIAAQEDFVTPRFDFAPQPL